LFFLDPWRAMLHVQSKQKCAFVKHNDRAITCAIRSRFFPVLGSFYGQSAGMNF